MANRSPCCADGRRRGVTKSSFQSPIIPGFKCKLIRFSAFHCAHCSLRNRRDERYILSDAAEARNSSGISSKHPAGHDFFQRKCNAIDLRIAIELRAAIYVLTLCKSGPGSLCPLIYNKIRKCLQASIKIRVIDGPYSRWCGAIFIVAVSIPSPWFTRANVFIYFLRAPRPIYHRAVGGLALRARLFIIIKRIIHLGDRYVVVDDRRETPASLQARVAW